MNGFTWKRYFNKIVSVEGDPTKQFQDLLVFVGYFAVVLYAGGYSFANGYNSKFGFEVKTLSLDATTPVAFVKDVLLSSGLWFWAATCVLLFSFVYYSCRYVWRPWFGYFVLALLLYVTFVSCAAVGAAKGVSNAEADRLESTSTLPIIKIYLSGTSSDFGSDETYRLLADDGENLFVFSAPRTEGSVIQVRSIKKSKVEHYEISSK